MFAKTFYTQLLDGSRFIDAVAGRAGRGARKGGNTWAAYQCYGDPDWRYRRSTGDAQRPTPPPPSQEFAGIASAAGLVLTLETLAVKSEFQGAEERRAGRTASIIWRDVRQRILAEQRRGGGGLRQRLGEGRKFDEAIAWYERARGRLMARRRLPPSSSSRT